MVLTLHFYPLLNKNVPSFRTRERCLRLCDRLLNPPSVMLGQLIIRANEMSHSCYYSLPVEIQSDDIKSYKISKLL